MGARVSRLVSVLAAGGVLTASLVMGSGAAEAVATKTISASCGSTVTAAPGDTVSVAGLLTETVSAGTTTLSNALCKVQVKVVAPAAAAVSKVPAVGGAASGAVNGASGALPSLTKSASTPAPAAKPTGASAAAASPSAKAAAATPAPASVAAAGAATPVAASPAFAAAFATLPSSFMRFAVTAPAAVSAPTLSRGTYDAGLLFGPAFPALRAGAAALGFDPANAVTSASQVQALPVDGLGGGVGVPVVLSVLVLSGMAAFAVRRAVLVRARAAGSTDADADPDAMGTAAA